MCHVCDQHVAVVISEHVMIMGSVFKFGKRLRSIFTAQPRSQLTSALLHSALLSAVGRTDCVSVYATLIGLVNARLYDSGKAVRANYKSRE